MILSERKIKLLELLKNDARQKTSELARLLGVSRPTLQNMLECLEDEVIEKYTIKLRPEFSGGSCKAFIMINHDPHHVETIIDNLKKLDEVSAVYSVTGNHNLIAEVTVSNNGDLDNVINLIGRFEGIKEIQTNMVLSEKYSK